MRVRAPPRPVVPRLWRGAMSNSPLLGIYRSRAQSSKQVLEAWQREHDQAMAVRDLEDFVRGCLGYPALVQQAWQAAWDRTDAEAGADYLQAGREVQGLF